MMRQLPSRRHHRGGAMVEFLLMLPILFFIIAMAVYLGKGLFIKEETQIDTRYRLWRQVRRSWWHHDDSSWSAWDGDANGDIGTGAASGDRPRGEGEAIEDLYDNAGRHAMAVSNHPDATDYFKRIWNNIPGRHHRQRGKWFDVEGEAFRWMEHRVETDYYCDSASWTHGQEPAWLIAQYGPMLEIKTAFETHLADVPAEFRRMREEVFHAWFEEEYLLSWNNPNAEIP